MDHNTPLAQAGQLGALADRFTSLRKQLIKEVAQPRTGTDGLRRIAPLLTASQELVTETLTRLTILDASEITGRPGARASSDCLAAVVEDAAHASAGLAMAVSDNAFDAVPFYTSGPEPDSERHERHRQACTAITAHLEDAAGRLDNCATACRYTASWLYAPASHQPTGYQGPLDLAALADFTHRLRAASPLPVACGVGISTPALAAAVAPLVDAVVIGSPIVRALTTDPAHAPALVAKFADAIRNADGEACPSRPFDRASTFWKSL